VIKGETGPKEPRQPEKKKKRGPTQGKASLQTKKNRERIPAWERAVARGGVL